MRPYTKKTLSQKRAGGVAQDVAQAQAPAMNHLPTKNHIFLTLEIRPIPATYFSSAFAITKNN
jgi:hypothetical protein